ncbi:MAG: carboxypeptidase-like regulatory domain-containing protein, partial [Bacteroidetes bacterium]|nr:carboxypeptidase-like regulatory domain-containing protein [Bacteroidota bacterium]
MKKQLFTLLLLLVASAVTVYAQDRILSGTVNDENGQPLPGASVLLKGTTRGTNTNAEGNFTINVQGAGILTISTVG